MPGPVMPASPVGSVPWLPPWLKPENASVLDPAYRAPLRTLVSWLGLDDPQQVMSLGTPIEGTGTMAGGALAAVAQKFPMLTEAAANAAKQATQLKDALLKQAHLRAAPVERVGDRMIVSTRVPYAKNLPAPPPGQALTTHVSDLAQDPNLLKKVAATVREYPQLTGSERRLSDRGVVDAFVDRSAENIDALIAMQPPDLAGRSAQWYQGAHNLSAELAQEFQISGDQAAGILATQSPSKDWQQNVELARRIPRLWREFSGANAPFEPKVFDRVESIIRDSNEEWIRTKHLVGEKADKARARAAARIDETRQYVGLPWESLPETQQAQMLRAYSELTEPSTYGIYSPEGVLTHPVAKSKTGDRSLVWQSFDNIENAISILNDPSPENISLRLGDGHKVRSFFNNISVPADPRSVTVDTHNVAGALLLPLGGKAPEVKYVMGGPGSAPTGISGAHALYRDAVAKASQGHGLRPNQAQSVSWESVKGLFSPAQRRNTEFVDASKALWTEYAQGHIPLEELHGRIYDLAAAQEGRAGLIPPEWAND